MFDTNVIDNTFTSTFPVHAMSEIVAEDEIMDMVPTKATGNTVTKWGDLTVTEMLDRITAGETSWTKAWFLERMGIPNDESDYSRKLFLSMFYNSFKDVMLKKHKVYIDNDTSSAVSAFKVIPAKEQAKHSARKAIKSAKADLSRGSEGVTYIDESQLTEAELKATNEERTRYGRVNKAFRKEVRIFKNVGITAATAIAQSKVSSNLAPTIYIEQAA